MERTGMQQRASLNDFAKLIWKRFINRLDTYTYMWYNEDGRKGYSRATSPNCGNRPPCPNCKFGRCTDLKSEPLTLEHVRDHLRGTTTLAPFQLSVDNTVKYLEFDVDLTAGGRSTGRTMEDVQTQVVALAEIITTYFGKYSCMVEISGSKGYHVWMFFADQIAARYAYALGTYIRNLVPPIEGIEIEIFPKQVTQTSYGSATRIPFGIHRETKVRGVIVDNTFTPHTNQYESFLRVRDITEDEIQTIIEQNHIDVPDSIRRDSGKGYVRYVCISRLMAEGAEEGHRDVLLYRLGCYLRERGFDENMALLVMQEVNKKSPNPLHEQDVVSKMISAYKSDYSGMPCFREEFDSYCSSSCPIFEQKAKWRKTTVEELKKKVRD